MTELKTKAEKRNIYIYAKVKYNKPWELASVVNRAFVPHENGEKPANLMGFLIGENGKTERVNP